MDVTISAGAAGTWRAYTAGIATEKSVGINTTTMDDADLVGSGTSMQGLYISEWYDGHRQCSEWQSLHRNKL